MNSLLNIIKGLFGMGKYYGKKRNIKENDFLKFSFTMKNMKENKIESNFLKIVHIYKFFSPYNIE